MENIIAERIKSERKRKGYTKTDLAKLLGLSVSAISLYEKGEIMPKTEVIRKMVEVFDVDMDYLLGRTSIRNRKDSAPKLAEEEEILQEIKNLLESSNSISDKEKEKIIKEGIRYMHFLLQSK